MLFRSSVLGAVVVMMCVDHLVEMSLLARHLYNIIYQVPVSPLCWFSWAIIGISPVLSLMGVFVQWKLTAHGLSHKGEVQTQILNLEYLFEFYSLKHFFSFSFKICLLNKTLSPYLLLDFTGSKDIGSRQKKQARLAHVRRREARRRPQETQRRRKPPPLKRYAGDVLAPVSDDYLP